MNCRNPARYSTITLILFCTLLLLVTAASAAPPGTETRISFSASPTCNNILPSSDNGWIVWQESCTGNLHIIAYNYLTGVQLTLPNATLTSSLPNIRGSRVVWQEVADPASEFTSLFYTDLTTSNPTAHLLDLPQSYKTNPVVDGNLIVWEDKESSGSPALQDILMYNITSSTLYNLTPGTPDSSQRFPSIAGNRVVWLDDRNGQNDIFMNTTFGGWATVNVTPGIPGTGQHRPVINGDHIVWSDDSNTLYLNDGATTTILPSYSAGDRINNVAVCATYVAWKEQTGGSTGPWDIFVNNTVSSSPPERITNSGSVKFKGVVPDPMSSPVILTADSRVIWVDRRIANRANIYMFTYGTPPACPEVRTAVSPTEGPSPLNVRFDDLSSPPFSMWAWDFGDGSTGSIGNIFHTYLSNDIYQARLLAATPYCRNASAFQTIAVGIPSVNFTGTPTEGIVPLTVAFSGSATGSPTDWLWDFGDGGSSNLQNTDYVYTTSGRYTVNLTATNSYGNGLMSRDGYISTREGMEAYSFTNITGLSVSWYGSSQLLILDKLLNPVYTLSADKKILTVVPPAGYGWQNITFVSAEAAGFSDGPATVSGIIGHTSPVIRDLRPVNFSSGVGSNLRMNYQYEIGQYHAPAYLLSRIWEGTLPSYDGWFSNIIHQSGFSERHVGYTLAIAQNNFSHPSISKLNLSASSEWVTGIYDIETGRKRTYVIAMGLNEDWDRIGMVLPANYIGNDTVNHIEYFEVTLPPEVSFFSTFALAKLSGTGNPLQLITLSVTQHVPPPAEVNPPSSGSDSDGTAASGAGAGKGVTVPVLTPAATSTPAPVVTGDPGASAKVYTNGGSVVTQETRLKSTDGRATISLGEGIVAKNASGNPLPLISIQALPPGSLPPVPSGSAFTFAGMAYDIGPDGATFSPPFNLTFALSQAQWAQDYSVRSFDEKSGTWQELPTSFDAATGTVTAQVSHLCVFALFTEPLAPPPSQVATPKATIVPAPEAPQEKAQPPTTAVSIFTSMMAWATDLVMNNVVIIVVVIILVIAFYLVRQGKFPGSGG